MMRAALEHWLFWTLLIGQITSMAAAGAIVGAAGLALFRRRYPFVVTSFVWWTAFAAVVAYLTAFALWVALVVVLVRGGA